MPLIDRAWEDRLLYDQFSGGHFLLLEDLDEVHPGVEPGKVQFVAEQGGFEHGGSEHIVDADDLRTALAGHDIDLALGRGVRVELEAFNIPFFPHLLGKGEIGEKQENQGV